MGQPILRAGELAHIIIGDLTLGSSFDERGGGSASTLLDLGKFGGERGL